MLDTLQVRLHLNIIVLLLVFIHILQFKAFETLALYGNEWTYSSSGRLNPGKKRLLLFV